MPKITPIVSTSPDIMGGTAVFSDTRVPVQTLFDYLKEEESIDDIFVTADRNLSFQQNLSQFDLPIIVLQSQSNRLADLKPLVPKVLEILDIAPKGQATLVGI